MFSLSRLNSIAFIAEKAMRTLMNMFVFASIARMLGPEEFGTFGLVQAAFFIGYPIALFANQQVLIKYLVSENRNCHDLQLQALRLKLLASTVVYVVTTSLCFWIFEFEFFLLVSAYCLIHLVNVDIIYFAYFRAKQRSVDVLMVTIGVVIPFVLMKVVTVYVYKGLFPVVLVYVLEAFVLALAARYLFQCESRKRGIASFSETSSLDNLTVPKEMVSHCWPIFLSAVLVTLYLRIDQFMIDVFLPPRDLGYYTAAVKISEASTIVITAYLMSRFPRLLQIRKISQSQYNSAMKRVMRECILFTAFSLAVFYSFGDLVIIVLFGDEFLAAKAVLMVHLAGTLFIYYGILCTQWLVAEGLQIFRVYRVLAGLVLNVFLNLVFIPKYGILAAAVTTVVTQAFSSVVFNVVSVPTRPIFYLQMASLLPAKFSK